MSPHLPELQATSATTFPWPPAPTINSPPINNPRLVGKVLLVRFNRPIRCPFKISSHSPQSGINSTSRQRPVESLPTRVSKKQGFFSLLVLTDLGFFFLFGSLDDSGWDSDDRDLIWDISDDDRTSTDNDAPAD